MSKQVAVWIDHKEAHVVLFDPKGIETVVAPLHHIHHKHPRGASEPKEHPNDAKQFFHDVSRAVSEADEILLVGPSSAKLDFVRYLHQHERGVEAKLVGIETVDHPTDGQLVAYAKKYFERQG